METVVIQHVLGSWNVVIHDSFKTTPHAAFPFADSINGFQSKGHAVGYVKRVAKHTPDRSSEFHVYPYTNNQNQTRWEVLICDAGSK